MSFDGIVTRAVVHELSTQLIDGKINRIYQQDKEEILLHIRNNRTNHKLLISASSNSPRIYLTDHSGVNPQSPPMFCMLLRKHLVGGIILNIKQVELDRIIYMDISAMDELGNPSVKRLIIEIMGRHSNIILVDKDTNQIIESIKRVTSDISRVRQVLPGIPYQDPPAQDKINPLTSDKDDFLALIDKEKDNLQIFRFFYFNYLGLSPLISREICFDANIDNDRPIGSLSSQEIRQLFNSLNQVIVNTNSNSFQPLYIIDKSNKILAFHSLNLNQYGNNNKIYSSSISHVLDQVYRKSDISDRISQKSKSMKRTIETNLNRTLNKLGKLKDELNESRDREKYKIYADLISANVYHISEGSTSIELENFYDVNLSKIKVPLDKKISPISNAQKYYKKYSKLKNAEPLLLKQIKVTELEISYLEHIIVSIDNITEVEDLDEIRDELIKERYLKGYKNRRRRRRNTQSNPHHYISKDGFNIYVGKNNRQNEYLTFRLARKNDIWLHVQQMPGSHVIIQSQNQDIPSTTLEDAGLLAAYYSKARNSRNVIVDYTQKVNVKRMRNGRPGMVTYEGFKSMNVSPSSSLIKEIKKVEK